MGVGGLAPPTQEAVVVHQRHCVTFGVVDFLWDSGGQLKFLDEWASLMVLLLVCSGSSLQALLPVHEMHNSGSICHAPSADVIEREWLVIFTSWMSFMRFTRS